MTKAQRCDKAWCVSGNPEELKVLCEGSSEIQKAHTGDPRREGHVQGLFPGALVLLALLSKEEWKL